MSNVLKVEFTSASRTHSVPAGSVSCAAQATEQHKRALIFLFLLWQKQKLAERTRAERLERETYIHQNVLKCSSNMLHLSLPHEEDMSPWFRAAIDVAEKMGKQIMLRVPVMGGAVPSRDDFLCSVVGGLDPDRLSRLFTETKKDAERYAARQRRVLRLRLQRNPHNL